MSPEPSGFCIKFLPLLQSEIFWVLSVFKPLPPRTVESCHFYNLSGERSLNRGSCCTLKFSLWFFLDLIDSCFAFITHSLDSCITLGFKRIVWFSCDLGFPLVRGSSGFYLLVIWVFLWSEDCLGSYGAFIYFCFIIIKCVIF